MLGLQEFFPHASQGRHFSFLQGGKILTDFLGGAKCAKYEKTKFCLQKHFFFSKSGGEYASPCPPK